MEPVRERIPLGPKAPGRWMFCVPTMMKVKPLKVADPSRR
jgi:hypothetical protein